MTVRRSLSLARDNDRLVLDFPHNVARVFVFSSKTDKGGMPQVTVWLPLGKLYLRNQFRL